MKQLAATTETGESQQSKQNRKKVKIGSFTAIFLIQYFCLHDILPFSKPCPEIESLDQLQSAGKESLLTRDIT